MIKYFKLQRPDSGEIVHLYKVLTHDVYFMNPAEKKNFWSGSRLETLTELEYHYKNRNNIELISITKEEVESIQLMWELIS